MSGTRSNAAPESVRIISDASTAVKPFSVALTVWSVPRGIFAFPGVTSIL